MATVSAVDLRTLVFKIKGTSPLIVYKFFVGSRTATAPPPTNPPYMALAGWYGIPAPVFRFAIARACRLCGIRPSLVKLGIFITADGCDALDGTPLVCITRGVPQSQVSILRVEAGWRYHEIERTRPVWQPGWEATLRVRYDPTLCKRREVLQLVTRLGMQVGIGEGRNTDHRFGTFEILSVRQARRV